MTLKPLYLDRESVASFVGVSTTTMQRMIVSGAFPQPRQLTGKRVGWLVREVEEWAESRPVSSNLPVTNCGQRNAQAAGA